MALFTKLQKKTIMASIQKKDLLQSNHIMKILIHIYK